MKRVRSLSGRSPVKAIALGLAVFSCTATVHACTIFTLTDGNRTLFCNNEDSTRTDTMIWFRPQRRGFLCLSRRYACAYVGYADRWAQGGMNSQGLAFDWVAGYKGKWKRDPKTRFVIGNPAQRMLESCATVEEAVTFFRTHWDRSFSYAKILIADRSGTSVIIGAREGKLDVQSAKHSQRLGYGGAVVEKSLSEDAAPTLANAARILQAARQQGKYPTHYSNVFDLESGDIFIFRFPDQPEAAKLNLAAELKKGRHAYDIPKLGEQLKRESK